MNNQSIVSVESIIYGSFVKYDRLEQQVFNTYSNSPIASATNLNIFVDVYSVLKSMFSDHYRTEISDNTSITSGLINLCSHYRQFFKRLSVRTIFYLIATYNTCEINKKLVAGYNAEFERKSEIKLFNDLANTNFELLELLCPYLPDIHFIRSEKNYESSVMMANIIEKENNGYPNLIISKDLYPLQLCYLYPYTSYLLPVKKRGGVDESIMLPIREKETFRSQFWNLIANKRKVDPDNINIISPINFTLFSSLTRFPERNMSNILNVNKATKVISSIVGDKDITIPETELYNHQDLLSVPAAIISSREKALSVPFLLKYYQFEPESNISLQNIRDDAAVNMINSRFLYNNPIDVMRL